MKKHLLLKLIIMALLVFIVSSCSKRRNTNPFAPGDIYTATSSPVIATETMTPTITLPTSTRTTISSATNSPTKTITMTNSPVFTFTITHTVTQTWTNSPILTSTITPSETITLTNSPILSSTNTPTISETFTNTPILPSATNSPTLTNTKTYSVTVTASLTRTSTNTSMPTATATFTSIAISTATVTATFTGTNTPTPIPGVVQPQCAYGGTFVIDGILNEVDWASGVWTTVANVIEGTTPAPVSARYKIKWDSTYLIVGVEVTDPALYADSANYYDDDAIEVYIDANNNKSAAYAADDFLYDIRYNGTAVEARRTGALITTAATAKTSLITGGYSAEFRIPWSELGKTPVAGMVIGFDLGIDYDQNGGVRDGVLMWNGTGNNWTDTSGFGAAALSVCGTPTVTNTINIAWSSTYTSTITLTPTITPTTAGYKHPGAWSSAEELAAVKLHITNGQQPWTQEFNNLIAKTGGASSGINFNGQTQNSCTQEGSVQTDSELIYSNALAWYLTGTPSYYTKAMTILANYAGLQGFQSTGCFAGQSTLDVGWFGVLFANACELLRTSPNWTAANTTTYVNMFKTAFYPKLNIMSPDNGNIDLTQIDAMYSMAVFCDDKIEWNLAAARYQARMPAAFINSTWTGVPAVGKPAALGNVTTNNCGGASSPPIDYWYCPTSWVAGLEQETCRDNGHHVQYALDAAVDCAEIDYHQGSPNTLYASYQTYLVPALELLAHQFVTNTTCGTCSGAWNPNYGNQKLMIFEMGYNHYSNRIGLASAVAGDPLFYTKSWITTLRANAGATRLQFNIAYDTLTHAGVN